MRLSTAIALGAIAFGLSPVCAAAGSPPTGVLGVLGQNGQFRPIIPHHGGMPPDEKTATGTLQLTLSISIISSLPPATPISCSLDALVVGIAATGEEDSIVESSQVAASVAGSTATCNISLPYKWHLFADDGTALEPDSIFLSYAIAAVDGSGAGRTVGSASFATIPIPHTGKTTSFSLSTAI